jgi:hypothetical protein
LHGISLVRVEEPIAHRPQRKVGAYKCSATFTMRRGRSPQPADGSARAKPRRRQERPAPASGQARLTFGGRPRRTTAGR